MHAVSGVQLGHRLAQLREQAGMKQAELARQITWSQAVLSRVEAGERPVSDDELGVILKAIGTDDAAELATILEREWKFLPAPTLDHPDHHLLWRAEEMTAALVEAGSSSGVAPAFRARLEESQKEIAVLADQLIRRDHQIAFIGGIGIGKSTVICRATGLETCGVQGKVEPVPVLEVGAGGSTVCEVHLSRGPRFGIVVEPRSHDDIRSDVQDFVDQIMQTGQIVPGDDGSATVPREIERAIRNMAGLTQKRRKNGDGKTVVTDPAKELAATFPQRRDFVVEVLNRMGLHRRDRRDEWHGPELTDSPLEWMRSTFARINNGRHPEFSLPARIDLIVPEILETEDLEVSVIDTRGIDHLSVRADLEDLLEDPHTVSILCSGFNDAPSGPVQHLLQRARDIYNKQIDFNAGILVLARPDEALAVKDEAGFQVETTEEGYELKNEQLRNALTPYRLDELPTFFFNVREDDPEGLRAFLRDRVRQTRSRFHRQLSDVLSRTQHLLDNAEREQVQAVQREVGKDLNSWIALHRELPPTIGHIHDTLLHEIDHSHPSTVNAAVRREGEWRSLSYTHQLGHGARKTAVAALQKWIFVFEDLCRALSDSRPEAKDLLSQASHLMATAYDDLLRKVQLAGLTYYRDQLREDSDFWSNNVDEWGRGSGYLNRILRRNQEWFQQPERRDLEAELKTAIEREWDTVLRRVAAIFE
ncbi:helix-turn-helix domain-containing protein [Streptomyces sp. NPDC046931]|uniref:helix-turn-helix domain-containing protein n=1 Tax=Streptomyces sp. NPDC046931 TaxID=3154806 RepID=UPI0033DF893B